MQLFMVAEAGGRAKSNTMGVQRVLHYFKCYDIGKYFLLCQNALYKVVFYKGFENECWRCK